MTSHSSALPVLDHETVIEQLPLLAGGAVSAPLRAALEQHLAHCADCREHWQLEQRLAGLWQQPLQADRSPEPALRQFLERIQAAPSARSADASPQRWWTAIHQWLLPVLAPATLRPVLAGAAALGLGLMLFNQQGAQHSVASPGFRVLSSDSSAAADGRYDLQLVFAPGISDSRRQQLLDSIDAQLLGGPNTVGAVQLRPGRVRSDAQLAQLLSQLRQQPDVLLAEAAHAPAASRATP